MRDRLIADLEGEKKTKRLAPDGFHKQRRSGCFMPSPRIEVPRMQPVHFGYKLSKHKRMSIVVAVDCETQRTPEPYHKPCLSSPTEPTEHRKIEGLTHADLPDMRRGTIIFHR